MTAPAWRTVWSMVGRWLVYVPTAQAAIDRGYPAEHQLSFPPEMKAEAHMIGAASDMLAALKGLLRVGEEADLGGMARANTELWRDAARAAIAKAEGNS